MVKVAKNRQWLGAQAMGHWAIAPSGGVEPKHWYLACTSNSAWQDAGPEFGANIRFGGQLVMAGEVPQSAPKQTDGADYRNNRRQEGSEPVRFSNGQQLT